MGGVPRDADGDGQSDLRDKDADRNGRYDNGTETNATAPDNDGALLWAGIETGLMVPTQGQAPKFAGRARLRPFFQSG
ncbi:MAG TPA: hypothetical protein VJ547_02180 [Candidatus Thermoplasmatota archaeon]|nr:hypothetical protein [Candidatus Thermoplasmatota archaeon]